MPQPSADQVQQALQRILASPVFVRAGRVRDFLHFIVSETLAGKSAGIKESVVAVEVFKRSADFDARLDSVVRVEAHKLRDRLRSYYSTDGVTDSVIIEVPKGAYVPLFRHAVEPSPSSSPWRSRALLPAAGAALLLVFAVAVGLQWRASQPETFHSAAVLAFTTEGDDQTLRDLASALSDDIGASLSQISTLRIVAQTSSTQVRDKTPASAGQLHAEALVAGRLRRTATGVRCTVELLQASTGRKLYGGAWDRDTVGLLNLADEIAGVVARQAGHAAPASLSVAGSLPVQELYWRARAARRLRAGNDLHRAVGWYEEAVRREPGFSRAWAGLAEAYTDIAFHRRGNSMATIPKAREAARKALAINNREADAHASLARIAFFYDWDWRSAEQSFRESIAANPNSSSARGEFALALAARRRYLEAIEMIDTAVKLDPLSTLPAFQRAVILFMSERYQDAGKASAQLLKREPAYFAPRALMATSLTLSGHPKEAVPHYEQALQSAPHRGLVLGRLGAAYALLGARGRALRMVRELEAQSGVDEFSWVYPAYVFAALGETGRAIDCVARSAASREPDFVFVAAEPLFKSLEADARFQALLQKIGMGSQTAPGE